MLHKVYIGMLFCNPIFPFFPKRFLRLLIISQTRVLKIIFYNIILSQTINFKKIF